MQHTAPLKPTGLIRDLWETALGLLVIDTVNSNSWESLVDNILGRATADVILAQEGRLKDDDAANSAYRGAKRLRWTASVGLALRTLADRASGGCAVLTRCGSVISSVAGQDVLRESLQHRMRHAWVGRVFRGGIHCIRVYPRDSEGATEANLQVLLEVATLLKTLEGPWAVGGDFNLTPGELAATNWHTWVSGRIKAPDRATRMNSKYDYFVVDRSIDHAVAGVQVLTDGGLYPHPPCRLCHRANKRRKKIRALARL